ncbi:molybdopterin molybdotransferase MoeA [Pseudooceanicola sp. CBS1P-1]|uniref:Molybdopterin molybdenumtransferase n=1 Tax=Pseudooceanicola albus TaxID=2692189 RepID=A0A6L7GAK9_9RHOB|nr:MULTISPECIES: gephyrin-like molybdotransferase Glp [Pseudooceanicola]MBT9384472.1 molybdopterin molybdotransferase MoeA [Pseudooceanicola endophyticus]MXN20627.1 molybdopterin molybdenumtransferase MoeA [Pseudooceanicola albus]
MIAVAEALEALFALARPLGRETIDLRDACGRVLAEDAVAQRDQPPFDGSAMDGYAVRAEDAVPGKVLTVIGESAAGHRYHGAVGPGEAVRIFTGAPVPEGAGHVVIQEDVERDGDRITLTDRLGKGTNIRPAGGDFRVGDRLSAPRRLTPRDVALLASMNIPRVCVARAPKVALISTGDELVLPGDTPGPDQIIVSNTFGLDALFRQAGALPRMLPIARDSRESLIATFDQARDADLIVTIGGASVGDHDLVGRVAAELGLDQSFYKVAMRPGKPLMAGRMGADGPMMIGLPGNPVSAMVCGTIFVAPVLEAMQGLKVTAAPRRIARLAHDLPANGPREHYMRARVEGDRIEIFPSQDSSLLTLLAEANALAVRAPGAPAATPGDPVEWIAF